MATAKNAIDRRSARTRAMLQHALISLVRKKRYEAITIQNICEWANVGRSTFYAHYTGKDDLKRSGLEHLRRLLVHRQRDALARPGNTRERSFGFSLALFEHAHDHRDLYRALAGGRGGTVALGSIRKMLSDLVREDLAATLDKNSTDVIPRELVVKYFVGAYMAVLTSWLDGGAKLPPERIDAMFRCLASEGLFGMRPKREN